MPTVNVIEELHAELFGPDLKKADTAVAEVDAAPADAEDEECDLME